MNELTEIQSIKLGDFKEQLASIKNNIDVANKELEATINENQKQSEIFLAKKIELDSLVKDVDSYCLRELKKIESKGDKLNSDIKQFSDYKEKKENELLDEESTFEQEKCSEQAYLLKLRNDISDLEKICDKLIAETNDIGLKKVRAEKELNEIKSSLKDLTKNYNQKVKEVDQELKSLDKQFNLKNTELNKVIKSIDDEVKKINIPAQTLQREKEEFEKYRMDVRVMYDRANRLWCTMYPGKSLEDVLKKQ